MICIVLLRPMNHGMQPTPVQITTMQMHRLYTHDPWQQQWNLMEKCQSNMQKVLQHAVEQGKLQSMHATNMDQTNDDTKTAAKTIVILPMPLCILKLIVPIGCWIKMDACT